MQSDHTPLKEGWLVNNLPPPAFGSAIECEPKHGSQYQADLDCSKSQSMCVHSAKLRTSHLGAECLHQRREQKLRMGATTFSLKYSSQNLATSQVCKEDSTKEQDRYDGLQIAKKTLINHEMRTGNSLT